MTGRASPPAVGVCRSSDRPDLPSADRPHKPKKGMEMAVLKVLELMSDSPKSWEDATSKAINKASKSVQGITSAWVQDQSVTVVDGRITAYRVTLKVTFAVK
jgi:dodecin